MSLASELYPFLFIASKNIFSEGYTQLPLSLTPLSFSLFAGFAPSALTGDARGMVDISRSRPRVLISGVVEGEGSGVDQGERKREKKPRGLGDEDVVDADCV
jgi:hypothetical protein